VACRLLGSKQLLCGGRSQDYSGRVHEISEEKEFLLKSRGNGQVRNDYLFKHRRMLMLLVTAVDRTWLVEVSFVELRFGFESCYLLVEMIEHRCKQVLNVLVLASKDTPFWFM
jgi:hypothetical protein